ncbi:MAG: hypothetical protein KF789_06585 [Bdellovibrionaceae bacterium]|nr:hypothetical protein [Pseudobdellovibrionaceae bacterium]
MWRTELTKALQRSFAQRKAKNPRYSLRAFAKHLGISATSLTDLLHDENKWNLSIKRAKPLVAKLGLSPLEENRLLVFMGETTYTKRSPLPESHVPLLNDWLYSAVFTVDASPIET